MDVELRRRMKKGYVHVSAPGTPIRNQFGVFATAADDAERRRRRVQATLKARRKRLAALGKETSDE
jgi:hypothetical protein